MDSFFSLFDPSEDQDESKNNDGSDCVKKKDGPKGRRRGRRSSGKHETLPEESSFLCEPALSGEILIEGGSYVEDYFEITPCGDDTQEDTDSNKPKRRTSTRKTRRKKQRYSPTKDGPWPTDVVGVENKDGVLNNNNSFVKNCKNNVGIGVNNLRRSYEDCEKQNYQVKQVNNIIDQLEKVSLKDDTYTAGDIRAEDLEEDVCYSSDDLDDIYDSASESCARLPPEPRFGNVEYKLHLVNVGEARLRHLVTQLKWRLASGGGTAVYVVGARDCGRLAGLSPRALRASLRTVRVMADVLGATVAQVTARRVAKDRAVAELYIRKLAETCQSVELRVAVLGANEAGKSTLIGVLTQGELDNGRGSARLNMFRHVHEVRSGNTSSLGHEILGFDEKGNVVNYGCSELMTAERIGERSAKLVSFIDLAGHSKYQRTTLHGLTGYSPHCAMLVISATAGITSITEEHICVLSALQLPFFSVITKCEAPGSDHHTVERLAEVLLKIGKKPVVIRDEESARRCGSKHVPILDTLDDETEPHVIDNDNLEPISVFPVSCVTGAGLNALHAYLLSCDAPTTTVLQEDCEFQIDEVFTIGGRTDVVAGYLAGGGLAEGDTLLCGPTQSGEFVPTSVLSVHVHRVAEWRLRAGQCGTLQLSNPPPLRRGMALLSCRTSKSKTDAKSVRRKDSNIIQEVSQTLTKNTNTGSQSNLNNNTDKSSEDEDNENTKYNKQTTQKDKQVSAQDNTCTLDKIIGNRNNFATKCKDKRYRTKSEKDKLSKKDKNVVGKEDKVVGGEDKDNMDCDVKCTCHVPLREEDPDDPRGCYFFQADMRLVRHSGAAVSPGFQCTLYVGNVRQAAVIEGILSQSGTLQTGDTASVVFRFLARPELVRSGRRVLLRAAYTTAVGRVTNAYPHYQ